jgi:hypothetical protein
MGESPVKYMLLFLNTLLMSTSLSAQGIDNSFNVNATTYSDGILLIADNQNADLQLTIARPDNSSYTKKYSSNGSVFIDINDTNGEALTDGLYKYVVWPVPAVTYTREESSSMPDRNDIKHKSGPSVHRVSGSFRVVNGEIPDADLLEYSANGLAGAEQ